MLDSVSWKELNNIIHKLRKEIHFLYNLISLKQYTEIYFIFIIEDYMVFKIFYSYRKNHQILFTYLFSLNLDVTQVLKNMFFLTIYFYWYKYIKR